MRGLSSLQKSTAEAVNKLAETLAGQVGSATSTTVGGKSEKTICGMGELMKEQFCTMCGLETTADLSEFPKWARDVAQLGLTDAFKRQIIAEHIDKHQFYEDSKVPTTLPLLKMVEQKSWVGKDTNTSRPTLVNACEGLSPFLCAQMDEHEVASLNQQEESLEEATTVTTEDIAKSKKSLKATVPVEAYDFTTLVKTYANLIYALFTADSPLFRLLKTVVDALRGFSAAAKEKLSSQTKASILWIILIQSRNFGSGEIDTCTEFADMQRDLCSKRTNITHGEVPKALIPSKFSRNNNTYGGNKQSGAQREDYNSGRTARQKQSNPNRWHSKLKAVIEQPYGRAGRPSLSAVLKYCNQPMDELFTNGTQICTSNMFLGKCTRGDACERDHRLPTGEEVKKVEKILEKFIKEPTGLFSLQG